MTLYDTLKKFTLLFTVIFLLVSCTDEYKTIQSLNITSKNNKAGTSSLSILDSVTKLTFSRLNTKAAGGLIGTFKVGSDYKNKALWFVVSGKIRTNYAHSNATITFAGNEQNGEIILWRAIYLRYFFTENNKWCFFRDSILVPPNINQKYFSEISAFAFLGNSEAENFE